MKIIFATGNKGKVREVREKLKSLGIEIISLKELKTEIEPPKETGETFLENAYQKAIYYAKHLKLPVIAEDSGLVVEKLGGLPGVRSARFAGENATDEENNALLIKKLKEMGLTESPAKYVSFFVLSYPESFGVWSKGEVKGKVTTKPRGSGGFGYDPLFIPEGYTKTMAELSVEEKNKISHRGKALEKFVRLLKDVL